MAITLESIVPVQADRYELIQLLNLINSRWHQNEEAFSNRSVAAWPQWCEDQGFRFELLKDLALNLEAKLNYPKENPGLVQLIKAVGPAATTAQLLESIGQHLPQFLEDFDQLLQDCQEENAAMVAQAGGTTKEFVKKHPGVDITIAALGTGAGVGIWAGFRRWNVRRQQQLARDQGERNNRYSAESLDNDDISNGSLDIDLPKKSITKEDQIVLDNYNEFAGNSEKSIAIGNLKANTDQGLKDSADSGISNEEQQLNDVNVADEII